MIEFHFGSSTFPSGVKSKGAKKLSQISCGKFVILYVQRAGVVFKTNINYKK